MKLGELLCSEDLDISSEDQAFLDELDRVASSFLLAASYLGHVSRVDQSVDIDRSVRAKSLTELGRGEGSQQHRKACLRPPTPRQPWPPTSSAVFVCVDPSG